jgi:hypothetical protein
MPVKSYSVIGALLIIQPDAEVTVVANDSDRVIYTTWTGPEPTEAELDAAGITWQADKDALSAERAAARAELESGPPPQSLPGLAARVQALEILMGLKTYT